MTDAEVLLLLHGTFGKTKVTELEILVLQYLRLSLPNFLSMNEDFVLSRSCDILHDPLMEANPDLTQPREYPSSLKHAIFGLSSRSSTIKNRFLMCDRRIIFS
jgi:hypothetical protein